MTTTTHADKATRFLALHQTGAPLLMPNAWDAGSFSSSSEKKLASLTNQSRASAGLRALKVDSALVSIARWRRRRSRIGRPR